MIFTIHLRPFFWDRLFMIGFTTLRPEMFYLALS